LIEALLTALRYTYIPQLVRQGDRNAMAWSVENRVPFLSLPLVEAVLSLPEDYLVGDDALPKSLLRRAMKEILPEAILDRKDKVGFATSQSELVVLKDLGTRNIVNRLRELGLFEAKFLDQLEKGNLGVTETNYMLWRVVNLGIWLDIFQAFKADHSPLG
jgi:asparagine synthase (glutamine-hydrolysing)